MKHTHLPAALIGFAVVAVLVADASAMYHPGMGRFMQRDPGPQGMMSPPRILGAVADGGEQFVPRDPVGQYSDGMSLYEYVQGNPITNVDPTGLKCKPQVVSGAFIVRFCGAIGHEFLDVDGQKHGFYPDQTDKPGLFQCVPGVWIDENTVTIRLPDGRVVPRDVYFRYLGLYHEWQVKSRCGGKMQYGDKKGQTCDCVSTDDIKACLLKYTAPGNRDTYCAIGRNCRDYVEKALKACCAARGAKTHSPPSGSGGPSCGSS